jgi:plastocyanin
MFTRLSSSNGATARASRGTPWHRRLACAFVLALTFAPQAGGQTEQVIEVTIRDFAFITKQVPLQLNVPTLITIQNEDDVRHDFGSAVFQRTMTKTESHGVISYGHGIEGVYLDPHQNVAIRFTMENPGRYEFRCSIHPKMKGELLLLNVGAV